MDLGGLGGEPGDLNAVSSAALALPVFSDAWQRRENADQAVFDAMDAIERNDVVSLSEAIGIMKEAGDTADMFIDDDSFLASAVRWRCDFHIFEILLSEGERPISPTSVTTHGTCCASSPTTPGERMWKRCFNGPKAKTLRGAGMLATVPARIGRPAPLAEQAVQVRQGAS
jgi:hypothetical protein